MLQTLIDAVKHQIMANRALANQISQQSGIVLPSDDEEYTSFTSAVSEWESQIKMQEQGETHNVKRLTFWLFKAIAPADFMDSSACLSRDELNRALAGTVLTSS